jgi:hypothetical protein
MEWNWVPAMNDQVALELGDSTDDDYDCPAQRAASVDVRAEADELDFLHAQRSASDAIYKKLNRLYTAILGNAMKSPAMVFKSVTEPT